jgi:hypothetical protein
MKAYVRPGDERSVETVAELRAEIARIRALDQPTMLFLEHDNGDVLVVGLGAELSVLSLSRRDGSSFHSVGDLERIGFIQFSSQGVMEDFFAEMAVPEEDAVTAAVTFAETGQAPENITWEADWE